MSADMKTISRCSQEYVNVAADFGRGCARLNLAQDAGGRFGLCAHHSHMSLEKFQRESLGIPVSLIEKFLEQVQTDLKCYNEYLKSGGDRFLKGHVSDENQIQLIQQAIEVDKQIKEVAETVLQKRKSEASS